MPVEKPTKRLVPMQPTKPKGKSKVGPSTKINIPTANTRKAAAHTQLSGSNTVPKRPRRTTTMPRIDIQQDANNWDTSQAGKERAHATKSGAHPS
jgi:hypothetical protein